MSVPDPRERGLEGLAGSSDLRPLVARPRREASLLLIAALALGLGLAVFVALRAGRGGGPTGPGKGALAAEGETPITAPPPPPAIVEMSRPRREAPAAAALEPAPPPTAPSAPPLPPPSPLAAPAAETPGARTPVLVVDLARGEASGPSQGAPAAPASGQTAQGARPEGPKPPGAALENSDERFAARVADGSEPDRARASRLKNPSRTVPQGALIPAVLETAVNSDLPGYTRAVVSRDVSSFDGSRVLIPKGSRVIGEYRSAVALGQSRAFIIWTRILRPDGASIEIGSGGGDTLGRAGLSGSVDQHLLQRFGGAVLLTALTAAANAAGTTPSTQVVIGSSQPAAGVAGAYAPAAISPTIKVAQGTPLRIFVARDLDFAPVEEAP